MSERVHQIRSVAVVAEIVGGLGLIFLIALNPLRFGLNRLLFVSLEVILVSFYAGYQLRQIAERVEEREIVEEARIDEAPQT